MACMSDVQTHSNMVLKFNEQFYRFLIHSCRSHKRRQKISSPGCFESSSSDSGEPDSATSVGHEDDLASWFDYSSQVGGVNQLLLTGGGLDVSKLAKRRLPPGNTAQLYAQYLASARPGQELSKY